MLAAKDITGADPADRPSVHLMPGGHRRAVTGHPWVFSNEIPHGCGSQGARARNAGAAGCGAWRDDRVATFNPHTLIAARLLARAPDTPIDATFFADRLRPLLALR
jgi:23S rRNA (cytosine1962-C5)-methyltransferase